MSEINGPDALIIALNSIYIHIFIAIFVSIAVTIAASPLTVFRKVDAKDRSAKVYLKDAIGTLQYAISFAIFGIVCAYFLKLGININDKAAGNELAKTFATPFISLLTAGVAYAAKNTRTEISSNGTLLGVICFLLSCVISYETVINQTFISHEILAAEKIVGDGEISEADNRIPPPIFNLEPNSETKDPD